MICYSTACLIYIWLFSPCFFLIHLLPSPTDTPHRFQHSTLSRARHVSSLISSFHSSSLRPHLSRRWYRAADGRAPRIIKLYFTSNIHYISISCPLRSLTHIQYYFSFHVLYTLRFPLGWALSPLIEVPLHISHVIKYYKLCSFSYFISTRLFSSFHAFYIALYNLVIYYYSAVYQVCRFLGFLYWFHFASISSSWKYSLQYWYHCFPHTIHAFRIFPFAPPRRARQRISLYFFIMILLTFQNLLSCGLLITRHVPVDITLASIFWLHTAESSAFILPWGAYSEKMSGR